MRLLILGESDSLGLVMPERSMGWGNRLPVELEAILHEPIETDHVRFYGWGDGSLPLLESTLERGPFDAIVISATKGGFTIYSAYNRVRRLMGRRAGDWFRTQADNYDRKARWGKPPGFKKSVNRMAHRMVRKAIGQEPPTTVEVVTAGYSRVLARLARLEDTHVVVVPAPAIPEFATKRRPKLSKQVEQFRAAMLREAKRWRFHVLDPDSLLPPPGPERDAMFIDDVHKTPEAQALLAVAVAHAVAQTPELAASQRPH